MYKLFSIAGYDKNQVDEKFSGMINALSYGAPPHGGIAPGIDRIVMLLANEKNIREVTMFPMNQNAQDLMMNAPSEVNSDQLKELNLALKAHKILGCRGVTRSDFKFYKNKFYLLELNTQPGMTKLSLVPEIAAFKGISFYKLLNWIVNDASINR